MKLFLLTDYKNRLGSKWMSSPYRSGYDHHLITKAFLEYGLIAEILPMSEVFSGKYSWAGKTVLYTSCEEKGNNYKQYIEDIIFGLEEAGARVLPRASFLRANNNKVYMEIFRDVVLSEEFSGIKSRVFGTYEEFARAVEREEVAFPTVLKPSYGAMSVGVTVAESAADALRKAKILSRTPHIKYEIRDYLRTKRQRGYLQESRFQGKFISQPLIPGLTEDYKVLVYGDQYYVLRRGIRPGDFRASGSHYQYKAGRESGIPVVTLNFVEEIYQRFEVPHLSVDVVFDGTRSYLLEFQAVYFGTTTHAKFSEEYFTRKNGAWTVEKKRMNQEEIYAYAVHYFLNEKARIERV